jgi:hypothetical protein
VSSKIFVVLEIIFQDAAQSGFIEDGGVIQVFAAKGTDQPLDIGVLPRAAGRSKYFVNAHPLGGLRRLVPVYSIAVTEQIPWGSIPREGFEKLPRSPFLSGKGSDGEMKRTSAIMVKNQEEGLEGHRLAQHNLARCCGAGAFPEMAIRVPAHNAYMTTEAWATLF